MWRKSINTANRIKKEYQEFADDNWDVDTWVYNRFNPTTIQNEEMSWTNFAALNNLPVLFICENNFYSVYSPLSVRQPKNRKIYSLAQSLGAKTFFCDWSSASE